MSASPANRGEEVFASPDSRTFHRLEGFVRPYQWSLAGAVLAVLAFVATQVSIPWLIRQAVDSVARVPGSWSLDEVLIAFALLIAANAGSNYLNEVTAARLAQRIIFDMRRAMFAHLQKLPLSFMDKTHVGRVMSRLQGDVSALQDFFETSITAVGDFALLVGIIVVLFAMEWRLGLLTLAVLPALFFVRSRWLPRARTTFARARDTSSIVNGALAENIAGVRVVQGARREEENLRDFSVKVDDNFAAQVASSWSGQLMVPTVDVLTGFAMVVIVLGGGLLAIGGQIQVGVMIAFIFYVQRFFDPIRTLSQQYTLLQRATAAGKRIFEVLDVPVDLRERAGAFDPGQLVPSVEFRNVTFGYRPCHPVIHDFCLKIEPRQTVALVGPTGSGKTSAAALVRRFYDVGKGQVLVGGHDVRDLSFAALGRNIALVLQEPFLFTGTVLENIRYASGAGREQVIAAASAVRADTFIRQLPNGYDTVLDQRGQNLSIGQRQLLSFARALVADPQILILDEATASIDSFLEAEIQEALRVLQDGRTSILIAHRLATVKDADWIVVLDAGRILEQGRPADLLDAGGLYADLYRKNFASFDGAA